VLAETRCEQLLQDKFNTTIEASYGTAMLDIRIVARCIAVAVAIVGVQPARPSDVQTAPHDSPLGDWRGMSVCQVKPSGCRDEDSLYHFTLAGSEIQLRADKIVDDKTVTMGTSSCVRSAAARLECRVSESATLSFDVRGDVMDGVFKVKDGTVWRKLTLHRVP